MGGGNSDGIFNLLWTRRILYESPKAWLTVGKSGDPAAFGDSWAYCIPGGGYVLHKEEKQFRFPIAAVNLSTGEDVALVLTLPFEGEIVLPETNVGSEAGPNGAIYNTAFNPFGLGATWLEARGNELDITVATESNKWTLCFDVGKALSTALKNKASEASQPDSKEIEPLRELKGQKDKDQCLQDFARGNDTNAVIAVVKAGANPKYSSDLGWTALMVAAMYGTADMVDVLIAAGSDVNAADKNCGGQTILMWAARSRREAKQKVRSLLKAGAQIEGTSALGYNALMSAAGEGDLEVVEYLIQAGAAISSRDHYGETVLMAAARSGSANVISALIKAGAEINATDKAGMTALMHAAESVDAAGAVNVLLKSGADPKMKDKKGRTAFAIARKSNTVGSEEVVNLLKTASE
jgi:ankyrin repeat protein